MDPSSDFLTTIRPSFQESGRLMEFQILSTCSREINQAIIMRSLDPELFLAGANLGVSAGQSGSFFCFSPDRRFILKTVFPEEAKFFSRICVSLYQHFLQHKGTLIAKFYGFHGVQVPYGDVIYMVVMANVFDSPRKIHETYDIKGSWIGRRARDRDPPSPILLDLDLNRELRVTQELRHSFLRCIAKDVEFVQSLGIIDYSLLLGFHFFDKADEDINITPENVMNLSWQKGILSEDGKELYFAGIIDILQIYNFRKKIERLVKTRIFCNSMAGVSVAPPKDYAERFMEKMATLFYTEK
eukprot:Phypoly_transcript_06015.p2 GENE.Phypoly_transcript_06015~~Phypoly_transcript_06015.p2  ORF type:complete len:299 (+),score=22.17 Phypoly_transcript_06015:937-1833(+)